jgi:hypothetical protein
MVSSDSDDDMLPFPLTFNTSPDLGWKLQKADILPAVSVIASQRPGGYLQLYTGKEGRRSRKSIDAGASSIAVRLDLDIRNIRIQVVDDGRGMRKDDLLVAGR